MERRNAIPLVSETNGAHVVRFSVNVSVSACGGCAGHP